MKKIYASLSIKLILITALILSIAGMASAAIEDTALKELKKPVKPSVVLPKHVRWGCLVCHSDRKLAKIENNKEKSIFIDEDIIGNSMHKNIACIDCHTNFSYTGHPPDVPEDYRKVAGLACKKCHPYQYELYSDSKHGKLVLSGSKKNAAKCSDCHGSHGIQRISGNTANKVFREQYKSMCAKCHEDRERSYNDHYHGAAYKNGAPDAPRCWDCHNNHKILGKKEGESSVNDENLPQTCNKCHTEANSTFASYAKLIHGREKILKQNLLASIYYRFFPMKTEPVEKFDDSRDKEVKRAQAPVQQDGFIKRILRIFYPESLRPLKQEY